jgi:hypothetical protein
VLNLRSVGFVLCARDFLSAHDWSFPLLSRSGAAIRSCHPHRYFRVKFSCSRARPHRQDGLLEFPNSHSLIFAVCCSHFAAHVQESLWCRPDPKFTGIFCITRSLLPALIFALFNFYFFCSGVKISFTLALVKSSQKFLLERHFCSRRSNSWLLFISQVAQDLAFGFSWTWILAGT